MSQYNPKIHNRKSLRLKGYDYSRAGLYFITICVQNRAPLFGKIINNDMILNDAGQMIDNEWLALSDRFQNIRLHEYAVMPDHFHSILEIVANDTAGATLVVDQNKTLGDMVGAFESITTVKYIRAVKNNNWPTFDRKLWQRNYYERIIRNEKSFQNITNYIIKNPSKWDDG